MFKGLSSVMGMLSISNGSSEFIFVFRSLKCFAKISQLNFDKAVVSRSAWLMICQYSLGILLCKKRNFWWRSLLNFIKFIYSFVDRSFISFTWTIFQTAILFTIIICIFLPCMIKYLSICLTIVVPPWFWKFSRFSFGIIALNPKGPTSKSTIV